MKKVIIIAAAALAAAGIGYGIYRATKKNNNDTAAPAKPEENKEGAEQPAAPAPAPEAPAPEAGKTDEKENK